LYGGENRLADGREAHATYRKKHNHAAIRKTEPGVRLEEAPFQPGQKDRDRNYRQLAFLNVLEAAFAEQNPVEKELAENRTGRFYPAT